MFLDPLAVRAAPFALLRNSRKTECGAISSLPGMEVRAAPFALLRVGSLGERSRNRLQQGKHEAGFAF